MKLAIAFIAIPLLVQAQSKTYTVTAYCACSVCTKGHQPAANGKMPVVGLTCAGPNSVPFGTRVWIEGIGERVVTDRLARRFRRGRFDVFMADHESAKRFGVRRVNVTIIGYAH